MSKKLERLIFLLGFMGAGKSTLGKKLAHKIKAPFLDLDKAIVQHTQSTIEDIFEKFGEEGFRKVERIVLEKELSHFNNGVVAMGGGFPCFEDNMDFLNTKGTTIYLNRPPKELFSRLINSKNERPLLKNISKEELLGYIEKTLEKREIFYKKSDFEVQREDQNVENILNLLSLNA